MARAKKIDRAEARRRYRAQLAAQAETEGAEQEEDDAASRPRPVARVAPAQSIRMSAPAGIPPLVFSRAPGAMGAMRGAYLTWRPLEDLRLLPAITLKTPAVLIPVLLTVIAGAFVAASVGTGNFLIETFISLMLFVPIGTTATTAMGGSFLAGLLTPRAGWLVGLVASLVAWAVSMVAVLALTSERTAAWSYFLNILPIVPVGAAVGAFAAWYRRFLKLSTPARPTSSSQRRANRPAPKARPAARQR